MATDDALLLDDALNQRRVHQLMLWSAVAKGAGMSPQNLHRLRRGHVTLNDLSTANLEKSMDWPRGTIASVLNREMTPGEAAALPGASEQVNPDRPSPELLRMLTEMLRTYGEATVRHTLQGMADEQAAERERTHRDQA